MISGKLSLVKRLKKGGFRKTLARDSDGFPLSLRSELGLDVNLRVYFVSFVVKTWIPASAGMTASESLCGPSVSA